MAAECVFADFPRRSWLQGTGYRRVLEMGGYGVKCKCIFLVATVLSRQHIDSIRMASCRLLMAERKLEPSYGFNYQVGGTGVI